MTSKIVYEIIALLCCIVCAASVQGIGSYYSDNQPKWNEAFETCQEKQERLPSVKLSGLGLQLADQIRLNPNECFWTGAIYEHNTNYTEGTFPSVCCGTVRRLDGRLIFECSKCHGYQHFVCESDSITVSTYEPPLKYLPWTYASKVCNEHGLFLPSETNAAFLGRVDTAYWWINAAKILNLSPRTAKKGDIPLCVCKTTFMDLQCPSDSKTYCVPYLNSSNNTTTSIPTSTQSSDTYSAKLTATVSSISGKTFSEESYVSESTNTRFQSVTKNTELSTGNSPLIGGLTGAAVASIGTTVTIVIVKRIRRKRRANNDVNPKMQLNDRSTKNDRPQENDSYDTVFEDDFKFNDTKTPSPQMQTVILETVVHTEPKNVKDISKNNKDDNEPPLYSMVKKGHRNKSNADAVKACDYSDNKYVKIDFEKGPVCESSEHVYDKAIINDPGRYGESDENVYNKTDFSCKVFDKSESSTYDIAHFSQSEGSYYDTTSKIDVSIDKTYDHI